MSDSRFTLPLLEWINIPAGRVTLEDDQGTYIVAPYAIAKYPVTNAQFDAFIADGGYHEDRFWKDLARRETAPEQPRWSEPAHPRERVNWYEAIAFTRWLAEKTGLAVTLPTEMQWEWAAVKDTGWKYPYGDEFDKNVCNTDESGIQKTMPVDRYPEGASPFGVMDMSGNVSEWCLNEFEDANSNSISNDKRRVIRGGSWLLELDYARVAFRQYGVPNCRFSNVGFRVCCGTVP